MQPLAPDDAFFPGVLALNNAHAAELSWLEPCELRTLLQTAFLALRIGNLDAALVAFDQDALYLSPNFRWFADRLPRFVYLDRIVVAPHARGQGLAGRLYAALFDAARRAGHDRVVCEVNIVPPNPASDVLHRRLQFSEIGSADLPSRGKRVRYLERRL